MINDFVVLGKLKRIENKLDNLMAHFGFEITELTIKKKVKIKKGKKRDDKKILDKTYPTFKP